jgi:DNA repair protein RecO (recombination protein O)
MTIQKTEAFVLRIQPFRSSSLMVTFFSRSFGKLRGIAKGIRKEREIRGALFELFTHLEILFYERIRSDLHLISEASIVESHDSLRTRLETITYASYFAELVDRVCEVHDPHGRIFELLDFSFRFLPSVPGERLSRLFELTLLKEIGWIPYLEACLHCHNAAFDQGFFSIRQGALFCPPCARNIPDARPIGAEALASLRYYAGHSLEMSLKLRVTRQAESELGRLMEQFLYFRLSAPFKSKQFLQQISRVGILK